VAETFERMGRIDPSPGLPLRDAVPHGEPMRQIARARAVPDLATIRLDDQTQQPMLSLTDVRVSGVDVIDERVVAVQVVPFWLDPVLLVHHGDGTEHLFGCL
jgi:hypothetical protein